MGGNAERYPLPRALVGREGCDFSFSGLKTAAARIAVTLETEDDRRDLAASVQAAIARQLGDQTAKAMGIYAAQHSSHKNLRFVVAGGVAANAAVRETLQQKAQQNGFSFDAPPLKYCTDNAAMIALAGAERLALGMTSDLAAPARPRWPLDEAAALAQPMNKFGRKGAKS
jgi:N6-L-threonylcarbamoyladenine synthase